MAIDDYQKRALERRVEKKEMKMHADDAHAWYLDYKHGDQKYFSRLKSLEVDRFLSFLFTEVYGEVGEKVGNIIPIFVTAQEKEGSFNNNKGSIEILKDSTHGVIQACFIVNTAKNTVTIKDFFIRERRKWICGFGNLASGFTNYAAQYISKIAPIEKILVDKAVTRKNDEVINDLIRHFSARLKFFGT